MTKANQTLMTAKPSGSRKLKRRSLPKFDPSVYSTISSVNLVAYAIHFLLERGIEIHMEDVVFGCFLLFPHKFALKKYPRWPDSAVVGRRVGDCRSKGYIAANTDFGFKLTVKGTLAAERAAKALGIFKVQKPSLPQKPVEKVIAQPISAPPQAVQLTLLETKAIVTPVSEPVKKKKETAVIAPVVLKSVKKKEEKAVVPVISEPVKKKEEKVVVPVVSEPAKKKAEKAVAPVVSEPIKKKEEKVVVPVVSEPVKKRKETAVIAPVVLKSVKKKEEAAVVPVVSEPVKKKEEKAVVPVVVSQTVSREEKARAAKFVRAMEVSDAYRLYKKNGQESKISEFDFRSLLLCTMESSSETLARNVELYKGYASIHNRQDLLTFLGYCETSFETLLRPGLVKKSAKKK